MPEFECHPDQQSTASPGCPRQARAWRSRVSALINLQE